MPAKVARPSKIRRRVDRWVKKTGMPRFHLADVVGCHPQTIYAIEIGRHFGETGRRLLKELDRRGC